ncbi:MAG: chemotaxis-specific protein-glutamate methyltransferase CheB [Spirochaetes bacterium]|nr:chemotaxis-specific protein-glutamate methyltransferase CheB [Spirochaetota bacterium]
MKIQVLVVDDSEVYRMFLRGALAGESDIEVVAVASNGRLALPRVNHYKPEIVLLDYEMPEMDGLTAIGEIKRLSPKTRIIMFSSHTTQGAELTLKALELGADDFITKPAGALGGSVAGELKARLVGMIRAFVRMREVLPVANVLATPPLAKRAVTAEKRFKYCVLGISTGGPPALRRLLKAIPDSIQGSIFIVQHMPALFTAQLAQSLDEMSALTVREATDGMLPERAHVYIAPGGKQMRLAEENAGRMTIRVAESDPNELCKPSANILFNSVLPWAKQSVAVIMTGMGEDGYLGMRNLAAAGAYLMAQSAEDCVIFGMPAKPVRDGIVHEVLATEAIAARLTEYLR